jgi:hypothetical protein
MLLNKSGGGEEHGKIRIRNIKKESRRVIPVNVLVQLRH